MIVIFRASLETTRRLVAMIWPPLLYVATTVLASRRVSAGAFLGAITIAWLMHLRRRGRFVVRASAGFYAAIIAFTVSRNFYLSGLLLAVAGYCMIISVATINSLLQHLAEDHMRGRVMSIYSTAFLGLPPIRLPRRGVVVSSLLRASRHRRHVLACHRRKPGCVCE